ncbi:TetR/AcrR family transcriptional regulator, partial [Candidatus Binatus sp.]|uniref:TetR/AcrR family transcriptional regulator n=1 Tax=Candidatus Binatus sp. TaxID=2811406 RepID=UPI003CC6699B
FRRLMAQLAHIDGRLARSARTRHAVVDALLDLLNEGDLRPTAARIAERAGVSLRIVFHHFDDLEAIYSELADRQAERVKPLTAPISVALPFARRVEKFAAQRGRLLETLSPVRRSAVLMEPFRPALAKRLKHARDLMRAAAIAAFAPELSKVAADEKRATVAALDVATSWVAWEQMRRHQGLSETEARTVMATTIRALLAK